MWLDWLHVGKRLAPFASHTNHQETVMLTSRSDAQIQQDVLKELEWDTRVGPTEIGVGVDHNVVTLTGTVSSWAKKLSAEEAAHRVAGVRDVANDLIVKLPGTGRRTDTEIAAAVRQALLWDVFVPEDKIQTTVSDGIVTLRGTVEYPSQREDAARAIRNLAGVCAVENQIVIKHLAMLKASLKTAIRDALERRAERDASRIQLDVDEGHVTLSGAVHSWTERQAVIGAVRGTPGVDAVVDKLHISP
jgi:osmotically-inducible protein OsmY